MDEQMQAGMEIKANNGPVFENAYEQSKEPQAVFLKRTPQGLMRDDEEGKEISSVVEILEPGDYVNHQTITEINELDKTIKVNYFGKESTLNENEIFSVLIKEEIAEWKKVVNEMGFLKSFESAENMENFLKALELACLSVNMEECDYLISSSHTGNYMEQRLLVALAITVRKGIVDNQEDLENKGVIMVITKYDLDEIEATKARIKALNGKYLYTIAIENPDNLEVAEGDIIILC